MKAFKLTLSALALFFIFLVEKGYSYEDDVMHERGYYYVIFTKASISQINKVLEKYIYQHGWEIVKVMNVDKTAGLKSYYKTFLICKADYLKQGVHHFKEIGNLIPCRITVMAQGSKIKVMVEDVVEIAKLYGNKDNKFDYFINKVQFELNDILSKTKNELEPRTFLPQY